MTIHLDGELAGDYADESREHLAEVETDLLAMERGGTEIDEELVGRAFRALHLVRGGAGFFELQKIGELAHQTENVLVLIRSRKLAPTPDRVAVLLQAVDKLREMLQDPGRSNKADIVQDLAALTGLCEQHRPSASGPGSSTPGQSERHLRILLVEDDFACRLLLQTFLSRYGECHVAVNGKEAVDAFGAALEQGTPYDLICMDIMMPVMDGREAVRRIRAIEEAQGVFSTSGVTIIMTTAVDEVREVFLCFKELCDAYVMKPIDLSHLLGHMRSFQLVK